MSDDLKDKLGRFSLIDPTITWRTDHFPHRESYDRIEELEADNARKNYEIKKLWIALSTYENKVQEYASDCPVLSDCAYDWLNDDAGKTARAALFS